MGSYYTYIHVTKWDRVPPWFDKFFRTHLRIHRHPWRIKSTEGKKLKVTVQIDPMYSAWAKEVEAYVHAWYFWGARNAKRKIEQPPNLSIPSERPPHPSDLAHKQRKRQKA